MSTGIGVRALQLIGAVILTHLLLPDDVGEVGVAVMVTLMLSHLTLLGPQYVLTRPRLEPGVAWHATLSLTAAGLLVIGVWVAFWNPIGRLLTDLLHAPRITDFLPGAILAVMLFRTALIPERLLQRDMRFRTVSLVRAVAELSYTACMLTLAFLGCGAMSIIIAHITRHSLQLILMATRVPPSSWLRPTRLSYDTFRRILSYSIPHSIAGFVTRMGQMGDKPLMSALFDPGAAGAYQQAYNLADIPAVQVGEQIIDVLTPSLAQAETPEERKNELIRATGLSSLVVFPLAVGLGSVAPTLIGTLMPPEWSIVAPMLTVLSALSVVRPIGWTIGTYFSATDRPKLQMWLGIVQVVVVFAAMTVLGMLFGPVWACAGVGVGISANALASIVVVSRADGIRARRFLKGFGLPLASCVPMVAAVLGVRHALAWAGVSLMGVPLAAEVVAGGATYVVSALVIARPLARELMDLIRQAARRRTQRASNPDVR